MAGGGGGSILGMIISYRGNRELLRKKKNYGLKRKFDRDFIEQSTHKTGEIEIKPLDEKQRRKFEAIGIEIRRKSGRIVLLVSLLGATIASIAIISIIRNVDPNRKPPSKSGLPYVFNTEEEEFKFYLSEGDYWFKDKDWEYAAREYKKGLDLFPRDYSANVKYASALLNYCLLKNEECELTRKAMNRLVQLFPGEAEVFELRATFYIAIGEVEKAELDYLVIEDLSKIENE